MTEMKIVHRSKKSSLFGIERVHVDLIVATEIIHKGKHLVSSSVVHLVYYHDHPVMINFFCIFHDFLFFLGSNFFNCFWIFFMCKYKFKLWRDVKWDIYSCHSSIIRHNVMPKREYRLDIMLQFSFIHDKMQS